MKDTLLAKALAAKRESKQIEFKESFDVASKQDWCEVIKNVIAIANSGGGIILFGLNNRGEPTGTDLSVLLAVDPATIADRIHPYTENHFTDIEVLETEKAEKRLVAWFIKPNMVPTVFAQPGTSPIEGGKQRTAFGRGTIYFRHGAKSEPGTTEVVAAAVERKLESIRQEWLAGVRRSFMLLRGPEYHCYPRRSSVGFSGGGAHQNHQRPWRASLSRRRTRQHAPLPPEGAHR